MTLGPRKTPQDTCHKINWVSRETKKTCAEGRSKNDLFSHYNVFFLASSLHQNSDHQVFNGLQNIPPLQAVGLHLPADSASDDNEADKEADKAMLGRRFEFESEPSGCGRSEIGDLDQLVCFPVKGLQFAMTVSVMALFF